MKPVCECGHSMSTHSQRAGVCSAVKCGCPRYMPRPKNAPPPPSVPRWKQLDFFSTIPTDGAHE